MLPDNLLPSWAVSSSIVVCQCSSHDWTGHPPPAKPPSQALLSSSHTVNLFSAGDLSPFQASPEISPNLIFLGGTYQATHQETPSPLVHGSSLQADIAGKWEAGDLPSLWQGCRRSGRAKKVGPIAPGTLLFLLIRVCSVRHSEVTLSSVIALRGLVLPERT